MGKYLEAKCKLCRRAGEKLFLKGERCATPKCALVKRNYPPGFHGPKGKKRLTDYGMQLAEKQKAKRQYNLLEKQFKITFERAKKQTGNIAENFLRMLEMRLDNVIYRLGLADSRAQARQLVNHAHFTVNGRKVNIPSYQVREGDIIAIKESHRNNKIFNNIQNKLKRKEIPGWLHWDMEKMEAKVLHSPDPKEISPNLNTQLIVEFYSR